MQREWGQESVCTSAVWPSSSEWSVSQRRFCSFVVEQILQMIVFLFGVALLPACFRKICLFPPRVSVPCVNHWFDISQMTTKVKLWLPGNCKTDACPCPTKSEHARPDRVGFTNLATRSENGIFWWTTALKVAEPTGGAFLRALVAIYRGNGNELVKKNVKKKGLKEMKNKVSWIKPR